jgi:hypothetical protein
VPWTELIGPIQPAGLPVLRGESCARTTARHRRMTPVNWQSGNAGVQQLLRKPERNRQTDAGRLVLHGDLFQKRQTGTSVSWGGRRA